MTATELFRFDLWANTLWFRYLEAQGWPEPQKSIASHILGAQSTWLIRINGDPLPAIPTIEPTIEELSKLNDTWKLTLEQIPLDKVITFQRFDGQSFRATFEHIAHHVLDHGTYHRGELRGLCRAADQTDFPETGQMGYILSQAPLG